MKWDLMGHEKANMPWILNIARLYSHLLKKKKHSRPSAQEQTQPSQLAHGFRRFARSKKTGSTIQKNGFHLKVPSFDHWQGPRIISQLEIHVSTRRDCMGFPNLSILIVTGLPPWARWLGLNFCCQQPSAGEIILPLDINEITPTNNGFVWFCIRSVNFGKSYGLKYWEMKYISISSPWGQLVGAFIMQYFFFWGWGLGGNHTSIEIPFGTLTLHWKTVHS